MIQYITYSCKSVFCAAERLARYVQLVLNQVTVLYKLFTYLIIQYSVQLPSVLWHCWLGGRKGIRPVKNGGMVEVGTG